MKKILASVLFALFVVPVYLVAQEKSTSTSGERALDENTEVKDFKSFLDYVAKKEAIAAKLGKSVRLRDDETIKDSSVGIELSAAKPFAQSKNGKKHAYLGANKRIAVLDASGGSVVIRDDKGKQIRTGRFPKHPYARFAFSDSRIFLIGGGIDSADGVLVCDYDGHVLKHINPGHVGAFSVSNGQKYWAATAADLKNKKEFFLLYDANGSELLRHEIRIYADGFVRIAFSSDDKYVALDIPEYWRKKYVGYNKGVDSQRRRYVFDTEGRRLISEEDHDEK